MPPFDKTRTTTELPSLPIECAPHVDLELTEQQARTMLAIQAKTEQLKQTLRQDSLWGTPVYLPPRGFPFKPESKVPAPQDLQREADKLMASHYAKQDVAGILAKRYDVTPTTIRRKLNAAT